jgi:4-amino-4-deoxy-L-arabinose transferase-like glycosyltransferase
MDAMLMRARMRRVPWDAALRRMLARPALVVYSLAFIVRLVYNLTAAAPYRPSYDAALYDIIAHNLINRHCYCLFSSRLTVSRAPLWPWIMSAIYFVAGQHDLYPRLFYCLLGSGTCVIVYRFARDLFGPRTGLLAGIIAAVYTGLFLYDGWLYTESLFTFCVTGVAYALYRLQTADPVSREADVGSGSAPWRRVWRAVVWRRWALLCGLLIGAATLTRPNGLILLGVVALWAAIVIWARLRPWRDVLLTATFITLIAVALVAPWTARNYAVTGAFIPVETGLGEVLLGSYNDIVGFGSPGIRGWWRPPNGALNHDNVSYTPAMDHQDTIRALHWMLAHPATVVELWALHLAYMWLPYTYAHGLAIEEYPNRLSSYVVWVLMYLESIPIFLLAAVGLRITWRRWKLALVPVYLILGAAVLQNVLLYSTMRFRAPIEPLLVILAAAAVATLLSRAIDPGDWLARWRAREQVSAGRPRIE